MKLKDNITREIGYGGSAGGGKSYLGCFWLLSQCLAFPDVVYLMGRRSLTNLKRTTLSSFFKLLKDLKINPDDIFKMNNQSNEIVFHNGSKILLMDMAHQPSDPEYLRFGGLELTGAFLDESNEIDLKAIQIIKTRIGRGNNDKYNILPKLLETFNPSKNHVYTRYYAPWKEDSLFDYVCFIPALATDNPHLPRDYIIQLENSDEITRQRLLLGNFDYDDDARAMCKFENIRDCFTNDFIKAGKNFVVSDLAMQGRDNFVVTTWEGLRVKFPVIRAKSDGKDIETTLKKYAEDTKTPRSRVLADSDGMGNYLESYMKGIKEFKGGKPAKDGDVYRNTKNECAFKLAEMINLGKLYIDIPESQQVMIKGKYRMLKQVIIEELSQLKRNNLDKDMSKKEIINKDEMKKNLGRSPDLLDCLIMRMYYVVNKRSFRVGSG
jgi:hypothetical protein